MPWPLPALVAWGGAWLLYRAGAALGWPLWLALGLATTCGVLASVLGTTPWRRGLIALGFPLSLLLAGGAAVPAWAWLLPLGLLLLVYPLNAWRDAPLFPTPRDALLELKQLAPLPAGASVLDAGSGVGDGLLALRRAYPGARFHGVEWSWPLRALCALRCPWARVRQGDLWRSDWRVHAMVYMFQRPESMDRAAAKAEAELQPGAWLVSLEFEARALVPQHRLVAPDGRPVWLYRAPLRRRAAGVLTSPAGG
ncbi:hypothetical protein [Pseudorhodoferax sp. Leaf267]|uniref:hypothetical protein n=1 Tax=Pseudorhodoferax sp. Leaf267 TaxID=1736316 RepID=UPI000700D4C4|nr:hypothetical protein [Pseudorhodoferax sp. Leaf267]KQP11982.1 methyltransferase type 12 [Pseudorhodoferax sp. Leaf267]